ncbi:hypothetical protein [Streptomyces sp. bgisy084]|uniref:hypothetical protein n=1 Tax=Streptomyces sp. bgisy084 TaxID=3413777 RepID=UPI003D74956B
MSACWDTWTADCPPERAGAVYVTGRRAAGTADTAGAAGASLPGYWDEFVSRIGTGVSE